MCICKILRFIARVILGTIVATLLAGLLLTASQISLLEWAVLAAVLVLGVAFSWAVIRLVHLARRRCDGDR